MGVNTENYQRYMQVALEEAKKGILVDEQPYGAVLVADSKIIGRAHSKVVSSGDDLNHAEIVLIKQHSDKIKNSNHDLILVTTCEPCIKCFGSAINLGVDKFVYGSKIETAIKFSSGDIPIKITEFKDKYNFSIVDGILEKQCDELLEEFYTKNILPSKIVTFSEGTTEEKFWMKRALSIGKKGMIEKQELPIGVVLVAGDKVLSETPTLTFTKNSPIAHGDFMALLDAKRKVYSKKCERPLVLYSTLEPHILGFGAAIKSKVDKVVYGLEAIPDGGACYIPHMVGVKEYMPKVVGGVYRNEQYKLLKEFLKTHNENRVGYDYAKKVVSLYEKEKGIV